jgi:hypothetical protein
VRGAIACAELEVLSVCTHTARLPSALPVEEQLRSIDLAVEKDSVGLHHDRAAVDELRMRRAGVRTA